MQDDHDYESWLRGERPTFVEELEPMGSVEISATEEVVASASWGGWEWEARGSDRLTAGGRLGRRLTALNPFIGEDWGPPGYATEDELVETIPKDIRQQMLDYSREFVGWPDP